MTAKRPGERDLAALFDNYFRVTPAHTGALLDAAYQLRYQVYCVENAFENPSEHLDRRERDKYDPYSKHATLIYRQTDEVVGCVRLILPQAAGEFAQLPIHALLGPSERRQLESYDPGALGEVSRYAVSKHFRRRAGDQLYPDVDAALFAEDARRLLPHISLGLIRAVAQLAEQNAVSVLCAAMAPALLRLLERFGLIFQPIGPCIEYHGLRQPCVATVKSLRAGLVRHDQMYEGFVKPSNV